MSVDQTKIVDFFGIDTNGSAVLTISDHLPWDEKNEHIFILQEKINSYLAYIESGEIYISRPDAQGRKVIISVVALYHPNEQANRFLNQVRQVVEGAGIGFCFQQRYFNSL